ncbi:MAG: HU family DNA-binding protein [Alphaproteobacteria bacterium]
MNKNDLVTHIATEAGLTKTDAGKALDAFISGVTKTLKAGGEVRLVGFGTFSVGERKQTEGRNPRTGEKIIIKASKQVKFSVGKGLKDEVNG